MGDHKRVIKCLGVWMMICGIVLSQFVWVQAASIKTQFVMKQPDIYRTKGVTYIAAAQIFQGMGSMVNWNQEEKILLIDEGRMAFALGSSTVTLVSGKLQMDATVLNKEGRIYIPLNFFANQLGYQVSYKEGVVTLSGAERIGVKGNYIEELEEKRITISAAGDATLGYYKGQALGGRFDEVAKAKGYGYFMQGVRSIFDEDDLTIVNLEGPLTTRGVAAQKEFAIRGLPEYAKILQEGSIEVVNLANNHTYDYQKVGYDDTITALAQYGIGYFGEDYTYYTEINEIRVAIIGAKGWNNAASVKQTLKNRISEAKTKADLIIVQFHWGVEREHYANAVQQDLGKYVIDQGAHLVLGSHPHVIQGIGSYKGANIVYSMGNFCFGANKNPSDKDTFIYRETFVLTDEGIVSDGYEVIPCSISSSGNRNDYRPTILEGANRLRVLERLKTYSKNLK